MHKDRMFQRKCNWIAAEDSRTRTRKKTDKSFAKVSNQFSITLQEVKETLKQDVQKVVPRHRFISGEAIWTELRLHDPPSSGALSSAIEFEHNEDLDSGCEDEYDESLTEQEELEQFCSESSQKYGWFEHVELYLERADQIPKSDFVTDVAGNMSETSPDQADALRDENDSLSKGSQSLPEVSASGLSLDFTLTSSIEMNSVADVVHQLIEQLSDEMFSQPEDEAAVPVAVAGNVPSDAGYSTASGQDAVKMEIGAQPSTQHTKSSLLTSDKETIKRVNLATTSSESPTVVVATPLHVRPVSRIRSVLKKRPPGNAIGPPSTVKKSVTFSETGIVLNPFEERDRRVFREMYETRKMQNDSNILEDTLPRQQSTPKVDHTKSRGAKRKCVYDFDDDFEEKKEVETSRSTSASTQTDQTESTEEMIRTIVEHTINSFKEAEEAKSEEDSTERDIQAILQATAASFKVEEPKKKKRKKRKLDLLNDSITELHKKVDRLEKRQRRTKKTRRLIVKKVVPAKAKPSTDRCTQTDSPVTAEAAVATTFELSKPPPKPRAPRKRTTKAKAKQDDPAENGAPKAKRVRRKVVSTDQQTIPQCLNGDGGGAGPAAVVDVLREAKNAAGRTGVESDVFRMDDGQLVAEDSEDNLSQQFEIEESLPPLSPAPSRTLIDPRLIKGSHRQPPSIIDTQQDSPGSYSHPESPASHYSIPNNPADSDEDTESFNRQIIRLRIGSDSQFGSSKQPRKQSIFRRQKRLQPYPQSPKLRPPPPKLVSRQYFQTLYLSPAQEPTPNILWKDPMLFPEDTCKYIEQRLQPVITGGRLPKLKESYGKPCWIISLDVALRLLSESDDIDGGGEGIDDMAVPHYPQFSQEFSPIEYADGFNHIVDDEDIARGCSSGSEVPDD